MAQPLSFVTPARPCISITGPGRPQAHFFRTRPKSEESTATHCAVVALKGSVFGLRNSVFGLPSDFGLRPSDFRPCLLMNALSILLQTLLLLALAPLVSGCIKNWKAKLQNRRGPRVVVMGNQAVERQAPGFDQSFGCYEIGLLPFGQAHQGIAAMAGVDEDIAFRMPFRVLRRAVQRRDFWKMPQPAAGF